MATLVSSNTCLDLHVSRIYILRCIHVVSHFVCLLLILCLNKEFLMGRIGPVY